MTHIPQRRSWRGAAFGGIVMVALSVLGVGLPGVGGGTPPASAASAKLPFTDPAAQGYVGLCDLAGNNVTSGSITTKPFAWKAVASQPPPKAYTGKGEQAGLFIFQPRPDVIPAEWSGDEMTASSSYKNPKYPTAAATYKDFSLANFIKEFPSQVDGLYELRMHFGRKASGTYDQTYPASVIQVSGSTWHVVQGGTVGCNAAVATSSEEAVGIPQVDPTHHAGETPVTAPPTTRPTPAGNASSSADTTGSDPNGSNPSGRTITAPVVGDAASSSSSSSSVSPLVIALAALSGVLILVLIAGVIRQRRANGRAT